MADVPARKKGEGTPATARLRAAGPVPAIVVGTARKVPRDAPDILEKTAAELRSAIREGRGVPEASIVALRGLIRRLAGMDDPGEADVLAVRVRELEGRVAALKGGGAARDPLSEEVASMLASGSPPERYAGRSDRAETPGGFLSRVYGKYLEKGAERLYLDEIRRLDPALAKALANSCWKAGRDVSEFVPKRSDRTDRVAAGGVPESVARAAEALRKRRQRAKARSET